MNIDFEKLNSDNISQEELQTLIEEATEMKTRKEILSKYPTIKYLKSEQRYYIRLDGKQIRRKSKKDLEDYLISMEKTQSINELWERYMISRKHQVKKDTIEHDVRYFEMYIKTTEFGNMQIDEITIENVDKWLDDCLRINPQMKYKYFMDIKSSLSQFFTWAIQMRIIQDNPLRNFSPNKTIFAPPKETSEDLKTFSNDEKKAIIDEAYKDYEKTKSPLCLGIVILFHTGLRVGELCGLQWQDIDADNNMLHIRRQISHKTLSEPKTENGKRSFQITNETLKIFELIKETNIEQGYSTNDTDFVFYRRDRKTHEIITTTDKSYDSRIETYCRRIGISRKSCHDIRRTVITSLYGAGMNLKRIQNVAGHGSLQQTMDYIKFQYDETDLDYMAKIV